MVVAALLTEVAGWWWLCYRCRCENGGVIVQVVHCGECRSVDGCGWGTYSISNLTKNLRFWKSSEHLKKKSDTRSVDLKLLKSSDFRKFSEIQNFSEAQNLSQNFSEIV